MSKHLGAFLETLIAGLMPFFITTAADNDAARAEILELLNPDGTRTRAEMLSVACKIALEMAAIDTLAEANAGDLSPELKHRYVACAGALQRSAVRNEKALKRRLAKKPHPRSGAILADLKSAGVQTAVGPAQATTRTHPELRQPAGKPIEGQTVSTEHTWAEQPRPTIH